MQQQILTNNENLESLNQLLLTSNILQHADNIHNNKRKIYSLTRKNNKS
jgi:hypothetical protein